MSSRRQFLSRAIGGTGLLALGSRVPGVWKSAAAAAELARGLPVLVVIELNGGNDGLNTVVPHADDLYAKARPTLRIEPRSVLRLDDRVGLNPALKSLHATWEAGDLAVVQGVGYPEPNRSHFRAMEIWQTGAVGPVPDAGWLGRVADAEASFNACHVGGEATPLAVRGRKHFTTSLASLSDYHVSPEMPQPDTRPADDILVREVERRRDAALAEARRFEAIAASLPQAEPGSLRERLLTIRALLEQDQGFRVYYTSTRPGRFDTHAAQKFTHRELLRTVSEAVGEFLADLRTRRLAERVVVMLYSEFGRRVRENAQGGTDHGTAGPVLLAGAPVRGGLIGPPPDLADLDRGDLKFAVDFRDVYASLLRQWLGVDPEPLLGIRDERLRLF